MSFQAKAGRATSQGPGTAPRIVYHLNSLGAGGMESHALSLARGVAHAGWQVSVLVPDLPILNPASVDLAQSGITTYRVTMTGTLTGEHGAAAGAVSWLKTRALLRQIAPLIVHQHRTDMLQGKWVVLAARAAGVPVVVVSEHGTAFHPVGRRRLVFAAVDRLVDRIIAVSDEGYRCQLSEGGRPPGKIVRIHNGIDLSRFRPAAPEAVVARRADLGIPAGAPIVGIVARLEEEKGITYFLRALPSLVERWPGLTVLIAGHGSLRPALEAEAAVLGVAGHTRFLGFVSDTPEIISLTDVVVVPSLQESFGLVAAEALSVGRAVVASQVGGLPEFVKDGETGLLVPPRDPAALAQAVNRLLANPALRARLGAAGRQCVAEEFSSEAMTEKMLALYEELLASWRTDRGGNR